MPRRKSKRSLVYVVSVSAHLAVGAALALIPQEKIQEVVAIALNEVEETKKPEPPKPPEHHEETKPRAPVHVARPVAAPTAAPAEEPSPTAPAFTDIGLALDSSSSDGVAIDIAKPPPVAAPPPPPPPKPKVLVARPAENSTKDVVVKPRPLSLVRATYTNEARLARVQGRVVVELAISDRGDVTDARVLSGLGYGLDDSALDAARRLRFTPAMKGNRPISTSYVIAMRFSLGT